jgi:branched-chain amino acid transport system ATP-binding protein
MLRVDDIYIHYDRVAAVRGLSFQVDAGEIVCLVGPNGAGKSTTLLAISGLLPTTQGSIFFEDRSLTGNSVEEVVRTGIALIPEGRHIFASLTVEENLRLGLHLRRDRRSAESDVRATLQRFPILLERYKYPAGRLSGGEQQQLAIARALVMRPKFLMIDEPALGLAPQMIDRVYEVIAELRQQGLTLLIVEQSIERARAAADRIYVMRNGTITLSGGSADLGTGDRMEEAYFGFSVR